MTGYRSPSLVFLRQKIFLVGKILFLVHLGLKVLGRRGERVLRVLEMREDEEINEEGRVVRIGTGGWKTISHKRDRSPGGSP